MYYEINVALNGRHFFATAERSITSTDKLRDVYNALTERFTPEQGFSLTVYRREETSSEVAPDEFTPVDSMGDVQEEWVLVERDTIGGEEFYLSADGTSTVPYLEKAMQFKSERAAQRYLKTKATPYWAQRLTPYFA